MMKEKDSERINIMRIAQTQYSVHGNMLYSSIVDQFSFSPYVSQFWGALRSVGAASQDDHSKVRVRTKSKKNWLIVAA